MFSIIQRSCDYLMSIHEMFLQGSKFNNKNDSNFEEFEQEKFE